MKYLVLLLSTCFVLSSCVVLDLRPTRKIEPLTFNIGDVNDSLAVVYPASAELNYYDDFTNVFKLDSLQRQTSVQLDLIKLVMQAVHDFTGKPTRKWLADEHALDLLAIRNSGKRLPKGGQAQLLTTALHATGMKARTVFLMTNDAEVTKDKAGHYLTEVWVSEHKRWVMADPEYNLIAMIGDFPLSALDLQASIIANRSYRFMNRDGELSEKAKTAYLRFIPHHLFYFSTSFDQRLSPDEPHSVGTYTHLLLVPNEVEIPKFFQRTKSLENYFVIHSKSDFYAEP